MKFLFRKKKPAPAEPIYVKTLYEGVTMSRQGDSIGIAFGGFGLMLSLDKAQNLAMDILAAVHATKVNGSDDISRESPKS